MQELARKVEKKARQGLMLTLSAVTLAACGGKKSTEITETTPSPVDTHTPVNRVIIPDTKVDLPLPNYSDAMRTPPDMCGEADEDGHRGEVLRENPPVVYVVGDDCIGPEVTSTNEVPLSRQPNGAAAIRGAIAESSSVAVLCVTQSIDPYNRAQKIIHKGGTWLGVMTSDGDTGFILESEAGYVDEEALGIPRCEIKTTAH